MKIHSNRSLQDKLSISGQVWAPLFLLHASYWASNIEHLLPMLKNITRHTKHLNMDPNLVQILENILLGRTDLLNEEDQSALACSLIQLSLEDLILKTVSDKKKLIQILMFIFMLFTPSAALLYSILFKPIIGIIPIETVIATI